MNNEQVIKYISERSKDPHAALIAEWLLTGRDVEYLTNNEEWVTATRPDWSPAVKYRLVKPKMKPAYRVYKSDDSDLTGTVDRHPDGSLSSNYRDDLNWLSDWIEYDPDPKHWPTPLVKRIAAIDIKAAGWIVDHWDELLNDKYSLGGDYSRESQYLCGMFFWEPSEHGDKYWRKISHRLGEYANGLPKVLTMK